MENMLKAINEIAESKYSELKNQCSTYGELKEKIRKFHRDTEWESHSTQTELQINRIICNKINALFDEELGDTGIKKQ